MFYSLILIINKNINIYQLHTPEINDFDSFIYLLFYYKYFDFRPFFFILFNS